MSMRSLIALVLCIQLVNVVSGRRSTRNSVFLSDKPGCDHSRAAEVDFYLEKIIGFGPNGRYFPEKSCRGCSPKVELKQYCEETAQMILKIDSFVKNCFRKDIQNIAKILIFSVKKTMRTFCNTKRQKQKDYLEKLLNLTPCVNQHIDDQTCLKLFVNKTRQLIPAKNIDKIQYMCCNYIETLACSEHQLTKWQCGRNPTERGYLLDFVQTSISKDLIDFFCADISPESQQQCKDLPAIKVPAGFNKQNRQNKNGKVFDSFVFNLLDVVNSIEQFSGRIKRTH